jgi:transposase
MAVDGRLYHEVSLSGLKKTGRNPTDRGKQGVKRSLLTDANGLPLSLVVTGANTHDIKLVADTLDSLQTCRPGRRLHLCLDKGYEAQWLEEYLKSRYYEPHIQSRKEESEAMKNTDFKAHRWVVELRDPLIFRDSNNSKCAGV